MKPRTYEVGVYQCEIIGPSNKCLVFINGASHPCFSYRFKSISAARIAFIKWANRKS